MNWMSFFKNFSVGMVGQTLNLFAGLFGAAFNFLKGAITDGYEAMMQYNKRGIAFARQLGMSAKSAQAYTEVLISRAEKLGRQYGIASEQVLELQENLSNSTGKALLLNDEEAERMIQINKLVGSSVANEFTSEIVNRMGGQIRAVQGAVSKAYATAAKSGLMASQFSAKVAKNLSLANKLSFKNGVDGIIKMTALSEKLGFNLQSIESVANKFMGLSEAIESSAQLQVLGGAAGSYGSNPLTMAYEANYDPEALTERMTKILAGYATFDKKTGMANVNGMNREFIKSIADAIGIGMDEAVSIAKKQAEMKYKETAYAREFGAIQKSKRDFVMNRSYVGENGHLMINDASGNAHDISKNGIPPGLIEELEKFDRQDEKEIMKEQSMSLKSIEDDIEGIKTSFTAKIAEPIVKHVDDIKKILNFVGDELINEIAPKVVDLINGTISWVNDNKDSIKSAAKMVIDTINGTTQFLKDYSWILKAILGVVLAIKAAKFIGNTLRLGANIRNGYNSFKTTGSPAAAVGKPVGAPAAAVGKPVGTAHASTVGTHPTNIAKDNAKPVAKPSNLPKKGVVVRNGVTYKVNPNGEVFQLLKNGRSRKVKKDDLRESIKLENEANKTKSVNAAAANSASAKKSGVLKKIGKPLSKVKIGRMGGGALGVGFSVLQGVSAFSGYRSTKNSLDDALKSGQIDKGEYGQRMSEARTERNEGVGGAIGTAVGASIGSFLGPIGSMVGGLVGNMIGEFFGKHFEDIKGFAKSAWDGIKGFGKDAWESIKSIGSSVWEETKSLAKSAWNLIPEDARNSISAGFKVIAPIAKAQFEIIKTNAIAVWKVIGGAASAVWSVAKGAALGAWSVIRGTGLAFWEVLKGFFLGVFEVVKGAWQGLWDIISAPFQAIAEVAEGFKKGFGQILDGNIMEGIMSILKGVGVGIFDIISAPFKALFDVGTGFFNGMREYANGIWNGIGKFATGVWDGINQYVRGIWEGIGKFVSGLWSGILTVWYGIAKGLNKLQIFNFDIPEEYRAEGGIVGGDSYSGDKIVTGLNSGEMILNRTQQANLFSIIKNMPNMLKSVLTNSNDVKAKPVVTGLNSGEMILNRAQQSNLSATIKNMPNMLKSVLTNSNDVKAKPVGEKEYIYIPSNNGGNNGVTEVTVRDINLNISGTLKIDAGSYAKSLDANDLLSDTSFISSLKDLIKQSINNDINNGRYMNDMASMRGMPSQVTTWGRK